MKVKLLKMIIAHMIKFLKSYLNLYAIYILYTACNKYINLHLIDLCKSKYLKEK